MSTNAYWAVTLLLGLVVAVVAVVLLETFLRQVKRVERGADALWHTGKLVAQNTSTTWLLGETSESLDALTDEAGRHIELLTTDAN
jgi:hypothetical protein